MNQNIIMKDGLCTVKCPIGHSVIVESKYPLGYVALECQECHKRYVIRKGKPINQISTRDPAKRWHYTKDE